jgi:CRISPR-associated protein Cas2
LGAAIIVSRIEKKSAFRMGWILTMFDLPVMTDKERKAATKFRTDLLDNGYLMIQFSVYARPCISYEQMDTHIDRIKKFIPAAGNVRLMFMTDEQWKKSYTVIGENYKNDNRAKNPDIPQQVEFWE